MTVDEPVRDHPGPCGPCKVGRHIFAHKVFAPKLIQDQSCSCAEGECATRRGASSEVGGVDPQPVAGGDQGRAG